MGDVIDFEGMTLNDVPVNNVLNGALKVNLERVIIIGLTQDGIPYYAASNGHDGENLLMVEKFKQYLLEE